MSVVKTNYTMNRKKTALMKTEMIETLQHKINTEKVRCAISVMIFAFFTVVLGNACIVS